jgi:hypothetical protein
VRAGRTSSDPLVQNPLAFGLPEQPGQVVRLRAGRRLGDDLGGGRPDPGQLLQRSAGQPRGQLVGRQA